MKKVNNKKMKKKEELELRISHTPLPGPVFYNHMVVAGTEILRGYIQYCIHANDLKTMDRCTITNIFVLEGYRRRGYGLICLLAFLRGYKRVDTRIDSKAGLNLIIKAGFRTGDGINYIWEKKDEKRESEKTVSD